MYGKDLEKEGWLRFESPSQRYIKYSQDEIDTIVFKAYADMMKMGKGETNKKLAERFKDIYRRKGTYDRHN